MRRKEPRSGVQNIATAEGRGLRLLGQNEAPAGAKDFSGTTVFRPCRGFVFREESFPRPSAVATFWRRFAAENGGILTLRVFKIQFWRRTGSGVGDVPVTNNVGTVRTNSCIARIALVTAR